MHSLSQKWPSWEWLRDRLHRTSQGPLTLENGPAGERSSSQARAGQGPCIVAVGGGHGLSTLLRGLKTQTDDLTAIVTMADDGGSSGTLREDLGLLPPGDLRNCIVALAEAEPLMTQLFQYRFGRGTGLDGHAFGNLFIAAMAEIMGSFEGAISEVSRVLAVRGRILPSTLEDVRLCAEIRSREHPEADPDLVYGQAHIAKVNGRVERVYLQPSTIRGYPEAIRALLRAEMIVIGPGSLYTSVLPNLLVADIANAIKAGQALKVYVCNVATQPGETDDYTVQDHVRTLYEHLGPGFCDCVLANGNTDSQLHPGAGSRIVVSDGTTLDYCQVVLEDLVDRELPWRHDSPKLAAALLRLWQST